MSVSVFKTWSAGEILTASDLNSSFTQLTNNGTDLAFPLTKNGAAGGFKLTGLGVGSTDGDSVRFEQLPFHVCDFRLTLTTATPVTTSDVTAATTIYASPYKGNAIGLYDGTNWHVRTSAEFSLALGTLTSGKPYDVFCYDNGGTPTLEFLVWTNDTTRATALALQNGVLVKSGTTTRRYLGTFYTKSTTTTEDSDANRYLWNYYNRTPRRMRAALESTDTWTYTTATIRQANANPVNQLNFVIGYAEDAVRAMATTCVFNSGGGIVAAIGIGLDSTSTFTSGGIFAGVTATTTALPVTAFLISYPGVGKHFMSWNEYSSASGTTTWRGDAGDATLAQAGIHGEVLA